MSALTFACPHDHFAYILCNEHAEKHEGATDD